MGPRATEKKQLANSYIARELLGTNEESKKPQRERVADFFASFTLPQQKTPKVFCLPGARWAFENTLDARLKRNASYVGVERNFTIIETGLREMPGKWQMYEQVDTYWRRFRGFSTDRANVVWCNASDLMGVVNRDLRRNRGDNRNNCERAWSKRYRRWTHGWLDFSSPLGDEIWTCCKRLEHHLDKDVKHVPIAVTFMIGREDLQTFDWMNAIDPDGTPLSKRVTLLRAIWEANQWRTAHLIDSWQYLSVGGVGMGVATFSFEMRE